MANAALRSLESTSPTEETFADVLRRSVRAIESASVPYVLIGGVGSAALGRPRWTYDVDVLVAPQDADRALDAMAARGFETDRTNEHWIYKASAQGVVIDVIFRLHGDIYLDEEMLERAQRAELLHVPVTVAAPEDQIVIKAISNDEQSARHWNDALALIAACELDWDYLVARSAKGPRRVLSLLVYAQSEDLVVPSAVIRTLVDTIYEVAP
jgi:predicted nucleotidyltransferase